MDELYQPGARVTGEPGDNRAAKWRDLRDWLDLVDSQGELKRIRTEVDPEEELSGLTFMVTRNERAPALLFENLKGTSYGARVLTNMLGNSKERYALSVGLDPSLSIGQLTDQTRHLMKRDVPPAFVDKQDAPVNETILLGEDIDLARLPAPKFWPGDGGRYLGTGDVTFTRDPESGRINVGVYRQMLHGRNRVGLYCSPGKHGRLDREAWWAKDQPCEVIAAYGVDPAIFMAGSLVFGPQESELGAAGALMGGPVELTAAETVSLPIPARAEIVIEGLLHPGVLEEEGPLGEFTGYYGNPRSPQPVIEVTALHLRNKPIVTAALMASYPSCEQGTYYAIARSARVLDDLDRIGLPGVRGVYTHPAAASGFGMLVVSLQQRYAGHVAQALALCAQCPAAAYFTKWIIAVDEDVDPTDLNQVLWALSTRFNPADDLDILRKTWSTGLDPSQFPPENRPYGSKVLIDACKPHRHIRQFPAATRLRRRTYEDLLRRWSEFELGSPPPTLTSFHDE
jgi:4-hydroxy-3-polyprenylbenzoate decarboxylase